MEAIQQHEWEQTPEDWLKICPHCQSRRIKGGSGNFIYKEVFKDGNIKIHFEEPTCITRYQDTGKNITE